MGVGSSIGGILGGGLGTFVGGPVGTAIGSGLGTAIGAGIEAIPSLIETDAERENKRRLHQLQRMQELGTLGLTESEKNSLFTTGQNQIQGQIDAGLAASRASGASGMATGAGQDFLRGQQANDASASALALVAQQTEAQNLARKRQLEDEIQSRIAAKSEYDISKAKAATDIAGSAWQSYQERLATERKVQGQAPSPFEVSAFAKSANITDDEARGMMDLLTKNPELAKYASLLGSGASK